MSKADAPPIRDERGRFLPGNPGGPGRPSKKQELLDQLATDHTPWEDVLAIWNKMIADAKAGDWRARDCLFRYILPPPPKEEEAEVDGGVTVILPDWGNRSITSLPDEAQQLLREAGFWPAVDVLDDLTKAPARSSANTPGRACLP
jgi:hypothetical protein